MFDLPIETSAQTRAYSKFLRQLKKLGFFAFQKSIYMKMVIDYQASLSTEREVRKILPKDGFVGILQITEKQFSEMKIVLGEFNTDVLNTDERCVEL